MVIFHRPRWTRLDPSGVMVAVMVKVMVGLGGRPAEKVDGLVSYWRMRIVLALRVDL